MTDANDNRPVNMWEELNRPKQRPVDGATVDDSDDAALPLAGVIAGIVGCAVVVLAGAIALGGGGGATTDEPAPESEAALAFADEASDGDEPSEGDIGVDGAADASTDDALDLDEPTVPDAGADDAAAVTGLEGLPTDTYSPAVPAGAEGNYTVLSRGKLYLRGEIPSPLIAIGAVSALEEILGEGNVIAEYVINPEAPFEMGQASNVFIEDTVLFTTGSAEIAPDFYPLLGLGVVLLQLQEGVTIEIYGHTDSDGSDEVNLALSQARVDAVKAFLVSQGADASRIVAVGLGETDPAADNSTPEGRQANRRVELVVEGFVFSL